MKKILILILFYFSTFYADAQSYFDKYTEQTHLSTLMVKKMIGKNENINEFKSFYSTGTFWDWGKLKIAIIEGIKKDSIVQFALVYKNNYLYKNFRLLKSFNVNKMNFESGYIYSTAKGPCVSIICQRIYLFRTDTMNMKFSYRFTRPSTQDTFKICE